MIELKYFLVLVKEVSSRNWLKQLIRFGGVGVLATLVHTVVALVLIKFISVSATYANVCAFFVAAIVSYTLNALWSFEQRLAADSFFRFLIVGLISLGMIVMVGHFVEQSDYPPEISVLIIACIIPTINFVTHKFWTFKVWP